jgi:2-amino-4-hydroxy-6-hydroxymethyldihydropteridine diphosphokinase
VHAVVALGSNMDDPADQVRRGFEELGELPATRVIARSRLHRTAPVGFADQPDFINACALVETRLAPRALLDALLAIERAHGRVRETPNGPRTLDLDIILYGDTTLDAPGLKIPHPRAHARAFVLQPLLEVWPDAVIPGRGRAADLVVRAPDTQAPAESPPTMPAGPVVVPAKAGTQPTMRAGLDSRLRGNDKTAGGNDRTAGGNDRTGAKGKP